MDRRLAVSEVAALEVQAPVVGVFQFAVLDAGDGFVEEFALLSTAALAVVVVVSSLNLCSGKGLFVIYGIYRGNDNCGAALANLFKFCQLFYRNLSLLHLHSKVLGYLLEGLVGD